MPTYDYKCLICNSKREVFHALKEQPDVLCTCGKSMTKSISKNVNFVFKGVGWSGKNIKEKNYRLENRKKIGRKMAENYDIPQIFPNYKGDICSSWDQAKQLAKADGRDTTNYDKQVNTLIGQQEKVKEKVVKLQRGQE